MMSERGPLPETGQDKHHAGPGPGLFDRLRALLGLGAASVREDIEEALEELSNDADFSPLERNMLKNVLALQDVRVEDIMIPRADIVTVAIDSPLPDVLSVFRTAGHSRLPVHGETLDDPRGMVHIRDFLDFVAGLELGLGSGPLVAEGGAATTPTNKRRFQEMTLLEAEILRPVLYVPPSMPAVDLLVKMQTTRTHMALVIDEYGGTDGLASIEDIVEVIVGDIEDEHDEEEAPQIEHVEDGFIADARAGLDEVAQVIGREPSAMADAEDIDTLGGLITTVAGRVPLRGEVIKHGDVEFEVLDADPRRVIRVKIKLAAPPTPEATEPASEPADAAKLPYSNGLRL